MRKILLLLFFVYSFAATYYVDKNPRCLFNIICEVCDGSTHFVTQIKTNIKEAVEVSRNGDTIKICPGKYNESYIKINKNLKIYSVTGKPDDVVVYDESGNPIFVYEGWRRNIVLNGISIKQDSDATGIYIDRGRNFQFKNLKIDSRGDGIRQNGNSFLNVTFSNLKINAGSNAIVLNKPSKFTLEKSLIYSTGYAFYVSSPQGSISLIEDEIHSKGTASYFGNTSQNYTIDGCKFYTQNLDAGAINLDKTKDFKVVDSYFNSNGNGSGIWINGVIVGDVNISDNFFEDMRNEAVYLNDVKGKTYIDGNYFKKASYGIRIKNTSNGKEILNNIIKDCDSYGLWLLDSYEWRGYNVYYNCFIDNNKQANSRDKNAKFDDGSKGNYWSDYSGNGAYEIPDVPKYDHYPQKNCLLNYKAYVDYHMDECKWDSNDSTFEIKNYGSAGDEYNATAKNGADTVSDAVICRAGNIINDYYLSPKNPIKIGKKYTINMWLKFPLNTSAHNNDSGDKYFNIADRSGSSKDFIYLTLQSSGKWIWNVNSGRYYNEFPGDLNGWHMLSFVVDGETTKLYIDGKYENKIDYAVTNDRLSILFNSDYNTGNGPYGQSIGGIVDEFKIFDKALSLSDINRIYDREKEHLDYLSDRTCNVCPAPKPLADWRMDECKWDNNPNTYEIKDEENEYNASAVNLAQTVNAKLCRGGDLNGSKSKNNKYIELKNYPDLKNKWSFVEWIYFPLNADNHIVINNKYYFVIGSVDGTGDLAYFAKDVNNGNFYFGVYDNNGNDKINKIDEPTRGWHHIGVVSNGNQTILYIDAKEITRVNTFTKGKVKYIGTSTDYSNNETIGSIVDEVKIFNQILSGGEIYDIYYNEKNGLNYDGSPRVCQNCNNNKPSVFNAVDYISLDQCNAVNDWDNNITTKISDKEFNLTLLSKDPVLNVPVEANITRVDLYVYQDSQNGECLGDYKVVNICTNCGLTNTNGCKTLSLEYPYAAKCVEVHIEGKQITSTETNESNSTDDFAVRPEKFEIEPLSSKIKAGEDFNLTIKALDAGGNAVKDYNESVYVGGESADLEYNETKNGCITGNLVKKSGSFVNGEANVTLNYSEVGKLNIEIQEVNGSEFAKVDSDDTPETQRFIEPSEVNVTFIPHHFEVNASLYNYDRDYNFTYYDNNLSVYGLLEANISAQNADNEITKNYNTKCYAKDIDVNITLSKTFNNQNLGVKNYRYIIEDVNSDRSGIFEKDINSSIVFTYTEGNFTTDNNGSTSFKLLINFDRNISVEANPLLIDIKNIEINNSDVNDTSANFSGNAKYLYGEFMPNDIITQKNDFNKTFDFAIYDQNESDDLKPDSKELVLNLYHNIWHQINDGNVSDSEIVVSKDYNASNVLSGVSVNVVSIKDGNITFNIKRTGDVNFAVVHLLSQNLRWLWYSKFNTDYNISNDSTCLHHFCFSITWQKGNDIGEVGSGEFNGTEANVTETNSTKTGVKIFR